MRGKFLTALENRALFTASVDKSVNKL